MKQRIKRGDRRSGPDVMKLRAARMEREDRPQMKPAKRVTIPRTTEEWQAILAEAKRKEPRMYVQGQWT